MNSSDHINKLINSLTNDEDERQNLWVYYLSGNSPQSLASKLESIVEESLIEQEIQVRLWYVFKNPPSRKFRELLSKFSDIEQSFMCLLALGLTVSQLSKYKGISEVRIRQVIQVIRYNECWDDYKKYLQSRSSKAIQTEE